MVNPSNHMQKTIPRPDDPGNFVWLLSESAKPLLDRTLASLSAGESVFSVVKHLRKLITAEQAALIVQQVQLRMRAQRKFVNADKMFFTRSGMEMATDETIAAHKAQRFSPYRNVADICCSIGGDLIALARASGHNRVTGFDHDSLAAMCATANLQALKIRNASVVVASFADVLCADFDAIHIDPERRAEGRSVRGQSFSPPLDQIIERTARCSAVAIKVAPATEISEQCSAPIERQWIGHSRSCQQQMIWTGDLARHPNCRMATRLGKMGSVTDFVCEEKLVADLRPKLAQAIGQFIYEPHNVVLAAALSDALAVELNLEKLGPGVVYYTSNLQLSNRLLSRFRVVQILPAQSAKVEDALKQLNIGELEIKKRGVPAIFADSFKAIRLPGALRGSLLLTIFENRRTAIVAFRETAV